MEVCRGAHDVGVFLRPLGDTVVVMPPLSIELAEIDRIVDAIGSGLNRLSG